MSNPEGVRDRSAATKPGRSDDPPVGLASTVESADDAIITQDLNGLITSWNAGAERMFGYSPREARGQPISILIPVDIQEAEAASLDDRAICAVGGFSAAELKATRKVLDLIPALHAAFTVGRIPASVAHG